MIGMVYIMKINTNNKFKVLTTKGYVDFNGIRKLYKKTVVFKTKTKRIEVTLDHPFVINDKIVLASNLNVGDYLQIKSKKEKIIYKRKTYKTKNVYDLLNVSSGNTYLTNDINSHNCFIESGESAVDKELIAEFRSMLRPPDILNTPEYKVWEKPNPKAIYAIGVDIADGVGGCASCIQVFNVTDLTDIKQAACYNNRYIDTTNFSKEVFDIAKQWGKPWLVIERNSMGGEVLGNLRKSPYNYERLVSYSADQEVDYEKAGVNSSTNAKYDAVSNMRYWVNILRCVKIFDISTLQEIETFVKASNGTWHKQGGDSIFDDRVMAMIWCLFSLHLPVAEHIYEILQYDEKGKPLKIKRSYYDDDVDMYSVGQFKKDWGDADFVSGFISAKSDMYGANRNAEYDDLMVDGWKQWVQN